MKIHVSIYWYKSIAYCGQGVGDIHLLVVKGFFRQSCEKTIPSTTIKNLFVLKLYYFSEGDNQYHTLRSRCRRKWSPMEHIQVL